MNMLNLVHETIVFTWTISETQATFMDFAAYKGLRFEEKGVLDIKPHFKTMNMFQYLHFNSAHPRSMYKGIIRGEYNRLLRNPQMRKRNNAEQEVQVQKLPTKPAERER